MKKSDSQETLYPIKKSDSQETLTKSDSQKTLSRSESDEYLAKTIRLVKEKKNNDKVLAEEKKRKQSSCKDLEKLISRYSVETGNERERFKIFEEIIKIWEDVKNDLFCLSNIEFESNVEIPKKLRVFFGLEKPYSMKKSSTQTEESSVKSPTGIKSLFFKKNTK